MTLDDAIMELVELGYVSEMSAFKFTRMTDEEAREEIAANMLVYLAKEVKKRAPVTSERD